MEHNSKDADPSHLEKLVDLALEFDDDLILERAEAFHELARLNPARARALVFEIFDDPHRKIPAEDPTDVDKSRGFYEDHQALAFEVLHAISPV